MPNIPKSGSGAGMRSRALYWLFGIVAVSPLVAFVLMTRVPGWDSLAMHPTGHFWIVSAATLLSGAIGTALALSVSSVRSTRTVYLALGFIAIALIFATHGLGTPGFLVPAGQYPYAVVISAGLSQTVGAIFIALSVLPTSWPGSKFVQRNATPILGVALVLLFGYLFSMVFKPDFWEFLPRSRPWDTILALSTIALLAFAGWRYYRSWKLTQLPGQLAMLGALAFLCEAQISMYYGQLWHLSWWLYHGLLLAAFCTLIAGWAIEAVRAKSLIVFSRAIELRDSLDALHSSDEAALEALEAAVEAKDSYTRNHMGRVAEYTEAIAREMNLTPEQIEVAVTAGRIHDVGKITVPDAVLMKPGRLTEKEFETMKHHAARGEHIANSSRVLRHVSKVVRAHHERYAGNGYPDGLRGEQIPLEARIVAVADTFDALTSSRVYRPLRPWSEAVTELERVAGTQLDPDCVAAFLRWMAKSGELDAQREAA
jgi:HD superfamily phosphodiesterase